VKNLGALRGPILRAGEVALDFFCDKRRNFIL
jgi:hypothetical protein